MQLVMGRIAQASAGNSVDQGGGGHTGNGWKKSEHQPGKSIPTYESGSNLNTNSWRGKGTAWQADHTAFDYEHGAPPMSSDTDAVVLGGGESQGSGGDNGPNVSGESSSTGGMKRVGDGWVWQPS